MFNDFDELTVGSVFYNWRTYTGFVEFEIVGRDDNILHVKSVSSRGYDFPMDEEVFEHYRKQGYYLYRDLETALKGKTQQEAQQKEAYINKFINDKASFTEELLKKAYAKEIDGEYGDYVEAMAIKELAEHHFPGLQVQ